MNYNLGSGTNRRQDYISVDLYTPEADEHWDITQSFPLEDNFVDNYYLCHVIEHLDRAEWKVTRHELYRTIKEGGVIEIRCPNIEAVCAKLLANPDDEYTMMQLYGLQNSPGEYHKNGFNSHLLTDSFPRMKAQLLSGSDDTELYMRFTK